MNEKSADESYKWNKWSTLINLAMFIMVMLTFFGFEAPKISFYETEHEILSVDGQSSDLILPPLDVSPLYYAELKVDCPTNVNYDETLKFSVKFENKGKKSIEDPMYKVFIIDSVGNLRGVYSDKPINLTSKDYMKSDYVQNTIITKKEFEDGANFVYNFPSKDQKVIGDWAIHVYLFDKNDDSLISYYIQQTYVGQSDHILAKVFSFFLGFTIVFLVGYLITKFKGW